jgi:phosphate-selective porin O/P
MSSMTGWLLLAATPVLAQSPPPAAPPPDAPTIRVGTTIFTDYALQQEPQVVDVNGNQVEQSQFEITRAYINLTGTATKRIAFRLTTDVTRETGTGSALNGSYTLRLKFAYLQWNLDDALRSKDTYVRLGIQPTPWLVHMDEIYRYRFQGQEFEERDGYLTFADVGVAMHYTLARDYGDVQTGIYNGEGYSHVDPNDQKGWMTRGTLRPLAHHGIWHGLRVNAFYDRDAYARDAERRRTSASVTFEHRYVTAAYDTMRATDQVTTAARPLLGRAWSTWVIPKSTHGWEGLFRVDHITPDADAADHVRRRTIAGIAYWFQHTSPVVTALMLDLDDTRFAGFLPVQPRQRRLALHAMLTF